MFFYARGSRSAFTLAEVLISGFLVSIVTLSMIGLALSLLRGSQKASDTSVAQVAAEQILNALIYDVQPGGSSNVAFWQNSNFQRPGKYVMNRTEFSYQIDATTVLDSTGTKIGNGFSNNQLKQVQVNVYWWDSDQTAARQGYGKLEYHLVRLLSEGTQVQ